MGNKFAKQKVDQARKILHLLYSDTHLPEDKVLAIQRWIADPANEPYTEEPMRELFDEYHARYKDEPPTPGAWEKFIAANHLEELEARRLRGNKQPAPQPLKVVSRRKRLAIRVAAVLVPLFLVGGAVSLLVVKTSADATDQTTAVAETVTVTADQPRTEVLPDGSTVWLSEGAVLDYRTDFPDRRVVTLRGDAFFTVVPQNGQPFEVLYNDLTVRVLGTEFYLSEHGGRAEVTLRSGSVEVKTSDGSTRLEPHQQLVADISAGSFSVHDLTGAQMARLSRGRLNFEGAPLEEVLWQIGEFYDAEVEFAAFANRELIRLELTWRDELEDALILLQGVSGNAFNYEVLNDRVIIKGN